MKMCNDKTFDEIVNQKLYNYLSDIYEEYIVYENEVIHCINDECTKKHPDTSIYTFFRIGVSDITENFIIEKNEIEKKEEENFSYDQKLRDVKLYVKDRSNDYRSNEVIKLDKKYDYKFRDLLSNYRSNTQRFFNKFEDKKKRLLRNTIKKYHLNVTILTVDMEDLRYIY